MLTRWQKQCGIISVIVYHINIATVKSTEQERFCANSAQQTNSSHLLLVGKNQYFTNRAALRCLSNILGKLLQSALLAAKYLLRVRRLTVNRFSHTFCTRQLAAPHGCRNGRNALLVIWNAPMAKWQSVWLFIHLHHITTWFIANYRRA